MLQGSKVWLADVATVRSHCPVNVREVLFHSWHQVLIHKEEEGRKGHVCGQLPKTCAQITKQSFALPPNRQLWGWTKSHTFLLTHAGYGHLVPTQLRWDIGLYLVTVTLCDKRDYAPVRSFSETGEEDWIQNTIEKNTVFPLTVWSMERFYSRRNRKIVNHIYT